MFGIDLISESDTWLDILSAVGSFATLLALFFAAWSIRQSAQARNMSSMVLVTQNLFAEREKAQEAGFYGMTGQEFHVFQMTNLVEQACFIVNHGLVSGRSKDFIVDWLRNEILSMDGQEAYKRQLENLVDGELTEFLILRERFRKELKEREHWDKVLAGRRWWRRKSK